MSRADDLRTVLTKMAAGAATLVPMIFRSVLCFSSECQCFNWNAPLMWAALQDLVVDETIFPWHGAGLGKSYIKDKPHPWGFKVLKAADSAGVYI